MTDPIPLVLIVVAYLLVRVASQGDGDRPSTQGDPVNDNERPSLTEEGYPADSWDAAQQELDGLQAQEADRLRELQTVALIMTELLQDEGYPADSLTDD